LDCEDARSTVMKPVYILWLKKTSKNNNFNKTLLINSEYVLDFAYRGMKINGCDFQLDD
jgi:hypothetical protein